MMSKKFSIFFFTALLIGLASFNYREFSDCSKVKNGKFFYYSKLDRRKVFIERIDSLQIETDTKNNEVLRSKIIWETSCRFKMFLNALSLSKLNADDSLLALRPAMIEIISVNNDFYICIAKFSTSKKDYEFKDTMYFQK